MGTISRRTILAGAARRGRVACSAAARRPREFNLKYGNDLPAAHPINKRAAEACDAIRAATNGRVDIQIFPEQPARRLDRHAEPGALRRARHLHRRLAAREPDSGLGDPEHRVRVSEFRRRVGRGRRRSRRAYPPAGRHHRPRGVRQDVGQRLPPDHHQQQADQRSERPQGPEAARAGEPAVHLDVPRARHLADRDQLRRGLYGAADQGGRRAGKSARADRCGEVLRGAEILLAHRPHVGRLLDGGEQAQLGAAAAGPARDRRRSC